MPGPFAPANGCRQLVALLVAALGLASCAGERATPQAPATAKASRAAWTYEVVAGEGAEELSVEASLGPGAAEELTVEEGAEPFLVGVQVATDEGWRHVEPRGPSWFLPTCARGCRLRYRFLLGAAARASGRVALARARPGAVEAPPSTWLLRPLDAPSGTPFRFHVTSAPGDAFASGLSLAPGASDTYEGTTGSILQLPYAAFGRIRVHDAWDGKVQAAILPGAFTHEEEVLAWVRTSARAVETFYGRFPVPHLLVLLGPVAGHKVGFGSTMGQGGASIAIDVGEAADAAALRRDWVLVHEMIHTALPDVGRKHHWLEEGLATYVEPLARARLGLIESEEVWREWVGAMPKGQPQAGDLGLDVTHTWGRTYWGGALFCLVADVEIRERTRGQRSLDHALRAVVEAGGNIGESWPIERVLQVGDAATGVPVLRELYARMASSPAPVDLADLWKRLGVVTRGAEVVAFDDAAPLASVRRAMTMRVPVR